MTNVKGRAGHDFDFQSGTPNGSILVGDNLSLIVKMLALGRWQAMDDCPRAGTQVRPKHRAHHHG